MPQAPKRPQNGTIISERTMSLQEAVTTKSLEPRHMCMGRLWQNNSRSCSRPPNLESQREGLENMHA